MKKIVAKLEESYKNSFTKYNELNNANDDDNYDEEYDDTLTRKYEEGYSDALSMALELLKSLCITCHKSTNIVMHGHCGACYYGYEEKE
jgi:hypothetical protein